MSSRTVGGATRRDRPAELVDTGHLKRLRCESTPKIISRFLGRTQSVGRRQAGEHWCVWLTQEPPALAYEPATIQK